MEKFPDSRKVTWLWITSLTVEKLLDCEKLTFLAAEKIICLIILKVNANIETSNQ